MNALWAKHQAFVRGLLLGLLLCFLLDQWRVGVATAYAQQAALGALAAYQRCRPAAPAPKVADPKRRPFRFLTAQVTSPASAGPVHNRVNERTP